MRWSHTVPEVGHRVARAMHAAALCALVGACGGGGGSGSGASLVAGPNPAGTAANPPAGSAPAGAPPVAAPEWAQAFVSGNAKGLTDAKGLAQQAQAAQQRISQGQAARLRSLYEGVSSEYNATEWSYWIEPRNTSVAQPLIVGDQGNSLAAISIAGGGRGAGYGAPLLDKFNNNELGTYKPAFRRLLAWLVHGDASTALPASLRVGIAGMNTKNALAGMANAGVPSTSVICDMATLDCVGKVQLLLLGGDMAESAQLESRVRTLMAAGLPVLFVNTKSNWTSVSGYQVLAAMEMTFGPHGGNYWAKDKVAAGRSMEALLSKGDQFGTTRKLLEKIASDTFSMPYDWSSCVWNDCSSVPGLVSDLGTPVEALRQQVDAFNRAGLDVFATPDTEVLRYLLLWADVVRQRQIRYPMDKSGTPAAFEKVFIADALVGYVRPAGVAQAELGTFATGLSSRMPVSDKDETVDVSLAGSSGFTAIGRMAAPGKAMTIEVLDAGGAQLALKFNTLRSGSTRLFEKNKYNRPRFLESPAIALPSGRPLTLVSPYGGTLQLVFNQATPQQVVRLRLRGVAQHPFLDETAGEGGRAAFIAALNAAQHDWMEIKLPGIEVHSRADMALASIQGPLYAGKVDAYLSDLKTLMFEDAYQLAGFPVVGKTLTAHVQRMCTQVLRWDCTDATIHRLPGTQHINADVYASCGQACSGNPYDQQFAVNPRGLPESHELGHNLQKEMHKVYGDKSTEVSNNLFPIHKTWRMYVERIDSNPEPTTQYKSAFDLIKASLSEADPVAGAQKRMWSDGSYAAQSGIRTTFYLQWVHYWAQRQVSMATGWDIITLLYLHQRQFEAASDWAANRNKLGYSNYPSKPSPSGNDNLLIALSWITERDQRPTFDLWGIRYSADASVQVDDFGFNAEPAFFYANTSVRAHDTVRKVDMTVANPVWPF